MPIEIEAPDGSVVEFPDGTPDDVITGAMQQAFGGPEQAPAPQQAPQQVAPEQPQQEEPEIRKGSFLPISRDMETGEVSFDPSAGIIGDITRAVTLPGRAARGEADFTTEEGIRENIGDVSNLAAAATPVPAAARAVASRAATTAARPQVPELEALREAARVAFKQAEDAGVVISQPGFGRLALDVAQTVRGAGFNRRIHPKIGAALKEFSDTVGATPTLEDLSLLRRVTQSAARSAEPDERRLARIMIEKIDDFVSNMKRGDVAAGDVETAAPALAQARELWSRFRKGEEIDEMIDKARTAAPNFSGSGYENALRTQFRQLANNKKRLRTFSQEEQAMIKKVARGGPLENISRMIGKFAPTGVVSSALSGGAGFAAGGAAGAVALPAIGFAGRHVATQLTKRNVRRASELIRSGPRQGGEFAARGKRALDQLLSERPATVTGVSAVTN